MPRTCRDTFLRLSEYLDGNLSARVCNEFQQHMAICPECRIITNTLRKTIELCRRLPQYPIPPEVSRRLRALVRSRLAQDRAGASLCRGG